MSPPGATGEKTPKCKGNDTELALMPVTPANTGAQEEAICALIAAFTAAATTATGTTTALNTSSSGTTSPSSNVKPDIQFQYELPGDDEAKVKKLPTIPKCSLLSLPTVTSYCFHHLCGHNFEESPSSPFAKVS
jgi:hypothetical protein